VPAEDARRNGAAVGDRGAAVAAPAAQILKRGRASVSGPADRAGVVDGDVGDAEVAYLTFGFVDVLAADDLDDADTDRDGGFMSERSERIGNTARMVSPPMKEGS
jgi:hypothetical protein